MTGFVHLRGLAAALALAAPVTAYAQPVVSGRQATATAVITQPAQVRKLEDLNFGALSVTAAGTATVNPDDEELTTTGGVTRAGGLAYSALFEAVSPVKNVVHIRVPRNAITVTRVGGTETMRVDRFTLSGSANRNVVAKEPFTFKVGGTLNVSANQAEGLYVGTFTVDIQYP